MVSEERIAVWDARDRLVEELTRTDCLPKRTLYIRRDDGGTLAVGLLPERRGYLLVEWRGAAYQTTLLCQPALVIEPYEQEGDRFGGMFGFGEKGAHGWLLRIEENGKSVAEATLLPRITAFADLTAKEDRFFHGKRRVRRIPLWQLRPEPADMCEAALSIWERLLQEGG
ncbi:MAG: hypothetical protein GX417_07915 [Clostridiales bacterium]|nr:hypothetical protein [Clostridiales bacterium]